MSLIPEWVRSAILDHPTCPDCEQPVLTEGRERHIICQIIAEEPK